MKKIVSIVVLAAILSIVTLGASACFFKKPKGTYKATSVTVSSTSEQLKVSEYDSWSEGAKGNWGFLREATIVIAGGKLTINHNEDGLTSETSYTYKQVTIILYIYDSAGSLVSSPAIGIIGKTLSATYTVGSDMIVITYAK